MRDTANTQTPVEKYNLRGGSKIVTHTFLSVCTVLSVVSFVCFMGLYLN